MYDGATQLLRTFDVDTRRLLTRVRLRDVFALSTVVGLANGVALLVHLGVWPAFSLVDIDDGRMATIAAPGIDRLNEELGQFADLDDDGAVIAYNTPARTWPGRIRFIPRDELLRLMLSARR